MSSPFVCYLGFQHSECFQGSAGVGTPFLPLWLYFPTHSSADGSLISILLLLLLLLNNTGVNILTGSCVGRPLGAGLLALLGTLLLSFWETCPEAATSFSVHGRWKGWSLGYLRRGQGWPRAVGVTWQAPPETGMWPWAYLLWLSLDWGFCFCLWQCLIALGMTWPLASRARGSSQPLCLQAPVFHGLWVA